MIALDKSVPNSLIDYEKTFEEAKDSIFEYYKVRGYEREALEYEWWTNLDTRYENRKR